MAKFANDAAPLHDDLVKYLPSNNADVSSLLEQLHTAGQSVVLTACTYKAEVDNDFSGILTGILAPLNSVLRDGLSFWLHFRGEKARRAFRRSYGRYCDADA